MRNGRSGISSLWTFGSAGHQDRDDYKFEIGKGVVLKEGTDLTLIATGLEVAESLAAAEKLEAEGISVEVINMHTIKPLDVDLVVRSGSKDRQGCYG